MCPPHHTDNLRCNASVIPVIFRSANECVPRSKADSFRGDAVHALYLRVELRRLPAVGHAIIANDADPAVAHLTTSTVATGVQLPAAPASRHVRSTNGFPGL